MEKIPGGLALTSGGGGRGLPVRLLGQGSLSRLPVGRAETHAHGREEGQPGGQGEVSGDRPDGLGGPHGELRASNSPYTLAM